MVDEVLLATLMAPVGAVFDPHVPAPIADYDAWVCTRFVQRPGEAKQRKIPHYADGTRRQGQQGSAADRAKLVTSRRAIAACIRDGHHGIGFTPLPELDVVAYDFDNCVGPDGSLPDEVMRIVGRGYAEYSPSGRGVRAFRRGNLGNRKSPTTPVQYGFEVFSTTGYVTLTGNMLPHVGLLGYEDKIPDVDEFELAFCERRFGRSAEQRTGDDFTLGWEPRLGLTLDQIQSYLDALDPGMGRSDWFNVVCAVNHETGGGEDGFDIINGWSCTAHNYSGEGQLRYEWDRLREDGSGRSRVTMRSVIKMAREAGWKPDETARPVIVDAEELRQQPPVAPEAFDGKFRPVRASALPSTPPRWLIKGVLPRTQDPVVLFGPSTAGKAQPLDEPVLTPEGWRAMGSLQPGDYVIGSAGFPVRVVSVHPQGMREVWEVEMLDGAVVRCCAEHLWKVTRHGKNKWRVLTTQEMFKDTPPRGHWLIPNCAPVNFAQNGNPLPLDPYLLGALLGDGGITAYVGFTSADEEVVADIRKRLPAGHKIEKKNGGETNKYAYMVTSQEGQPNHVWTALRLLGLAGKTSQYKFVPDEYLRASPGARLELLQGLMDTDGYVPEGGRTINFSSCSPELTKGVADLVRSLGGICNPIRVKTATGGLPAHIIHFRMPRNVIPFRLSRKVDRCCSGSREGIHRAVRGIRPTGVFVPMQCISVAAEDRLYVTTGYAVTHNTFVAIDLAGSIARGVVWRGRKVARGRVLYITAEGSRGFRSRLDAYCLHNNVTIDELDIDVLHVSMNILQAEDVHELVKSMRAFGPYEFVVVDTLAQVTPGANENGAEDMGLALANLKVVQQVTGATVAVVHHTGKDVARGARGWSGIKAAAEAQIEVIKDEDTGYREILIEKMKDGRDGLRFGFRLTDVILGLDEDNEAYTSCVVSEAEIVKREAPENGRGIKRRGRLENHVLDTIAMIDKDKDSVQLQALITMASDALPPPEPGKRDTRRQRVKAAVESLAREKTDAPIQIAGSLVVICTE